MKVIDIDPTSVAFHSVIATIPLDIALSLSSTSVAITPDGSRAYVTSSASNEVAVIDTATNTQTDTIATAGCNLRELTVTSNGTLTFVASETTNEMLIIDTDPSSFNFNTVVGAVPVGNGPFGVAFQSLSVAVAYISNMDGGTISVIGTMALEVPVDIKPQSCPNPLNISSRGLLPVAVLGTENFDVMTIDPVFIQLEGIPPIRSNVEDVSRLVVDRQDVCDCTIEGPDGFADLTLKFDTQEIIDALGDVNDGDELVLTLTGELHDGTPIEGKDCVWILKKGKGKK